MTSQLQNGRHTLTVLSTKPHDAGVYKCVARNKFGTVTCRSRLLLGDAPTRPGRPHVTRLGEREAFLIWEEPEHDGNSYIQAYRVDQHRPHSERWEVATYCIDECALVKNLKPDTSYRSVLPSNKVGCCVAIQEASLLSQVSNLRSQQLRSQSVQLGLG